MSKPRRAAPNLRMRLNLLAAGLACCGVLLVARAADLQLLRADFYQQQGDQRFLRELPMPTSRGMITDRNGEPLAVSTPVESLWANPQELRSTRAHPRAGRGAGHAGRPRCSSGGAARRPRVRVPAPADEPGRRRAVLALGIPGVHSQREFRRFYPMGEMMAHVLGFTNIDDRRPGRASSWPSTTG
jgi:cell division protein FtsI (penicillin-binding protein 3)